ncbi:MAG: serine hydrolase [Patescibacteria group bacterium]
MLAFISQFFVLWGLMNLYPINGAALEAVALGNDFYFTPQDAITILTEVEDELIDFSFAPKKYVPESLGVITDAKSVLILDRKSKLVLYQKNIHIQQAIGSITKLMCAYVFIKTNPDLDAIVEIRQEDFRSGGVEHIGLNDPVKARDLLTASLVASDNSATAALVRLSGLDHQEFIYKMNETAKEFGMNHTVFSDETGLSADNRSVVGDVAKLLDNVLQEELIRGATEMPEASVTSESGRVYTMRATNELLYSFISQPPYHIVGGKTGYLPEAGYSLGAVFDHDQKGEIIVVALGSPTNFSRFHDVKSLAAWAYKVFLWPSES